MEKIFKTLIWALYE